MASSDLDVAIGASERVLLDTTVLIAFHTPYETAHPLANHLLRRIEREADSLHGYYSSISASEMLIRPIRAGRAEYMHMYGFLTNFPHLDVIPADLPIAVEAANVRAITRVGLADAFIIATGIFCGCEAIVSNDEQWKRQMEPLFPAFRWLYLGDYL